jgi:hypothetical protein
MHREAAQLRLLETDAHITGADRVKASAADAIRAIKDADSVPSAADALTGLPELDILQSSINAFIDEARPGT